MLHYTLQFGVFCGVYFFGCNLEYLVGRVEDRSTAWLYVTFDTLVYSYKDPLSCKRKQVVVSEINFCEIDYFEFHWVFADHQDPGTLENYLFMAAFYIKVQFHVQKFQKGAKFFLECRLVKEQVLDL